ncbi:MAG: GNAT family N-acetyltransferase [bacterium]|nr:GNAT family N-acetyltransferase [bacterium]
MKPDSPQTIVDLMENLDQSPPVEAARLLEDALGAAAGEGDASSSVADAALVELLNDRRRGDALLDHLSLAMLEDLAERANRRLTTAQQDSDEPRRRAWGVLDLLRRSKVLCRIHESDSTTQWTQRILRLVESSQFTFGRLFAQRCAAYGARTLFRLPGPTGSRAITWRQVEGRVELVARGLIATTAQSDDAPVAILSENRLEMALIDLACLTSGIVNVMIPATATDSEVGYILGHAGAGTVVVSTGEQLQKVLKAKEGLPALKTIIALEAEAATVRGVLPFEGVLERASEVSAEAVVARRERVRIDELATVMYTSGTTGTPKGIMFSHRNIVFKRFARALALPRIGEDDRFLCYLPLFHTFGRFLELTGCIFWGATYCFAESPAIATLVRQMQELRPTVFISIPMKWMELYDLVRQEVDVEVDDERKIREATRRITGGELRWGLSAAGYLDPDIFRFLQRQGIELMSGFGMTEATGGITMTPPGGYQDDSLGGALPGIELALAADGELKIRGPYVMMGHLDPPDGAASFDDEGWFHTGDLMEMDESRFIRLVDRKKEIYKNVKGQTIAPQKIENLFRDFESVGRIFLVGDHRKYNTALIYPNPKFEELDLEALSSEELEAHFSSLVVSANSFLAPYERIVDFALIDRDFELERGELTPKGTFRRKTIERTFSDVIRLLYRRTTLQVGGVAVTVPNWLFQALGITAQDLQVDDDRLNLSSVGTALVVRRIADDEVQVGSVVYRLLGRALELGTLLSTPNLWLGNGELVRFVPLEPEKRHRQRRLSRELEWLRRSAAFDATEADRQAAMELLVKTKLELSDLHQAALLLAAAEPANAVLAIRVLEHALAQGNGPITDAALAILRRAAASPAPEVLRRAFQVLVLAEQMECYRRTLAQFLDGPVPVPDAETTSVLVERDLSRERLDALIAEAEERSERGGDSATEALLDFLCEYGAAHPSRYRHLRIFFTRMALVAPTQGIRLHAAEAKLMMERGFRSWLGPPSRIAVDPETGFEYRWEDVVAFANDVDAEAGKRLMAAFKNTSILREAVFLFSGGTEIHLDNILPNGVWVRLLGTDHGKSVYRVAIRTRGGEQADLAINLNRTLSPAQLRKEVNWLIVCGETRNRRPLVENFGGYWPEHGLWSEEFIAGETLDRALRRISRRKRDEERFVVFWPSAAWSAMSAYVDLWDRTGEANPTASNVIVPTHDYQIGVRLVSISGGRPFTGIFHFLQSLREQFVVPMEDAHPRLAGLVGWEIVFSAVLEILGEEEGVARLRRALAEREARPSEEFRRAMESFLGSVERGGFLPRRLYFAVQRFRRWAQLNPDATVEAHASTLQELYETYFLADLQPAYPGARTRFFRDTVLRRASDPLTEGLDSLIRRLRTRELEPDEVSAAVADLRAQLKLSPDEDYFLARLSYPYLRPEDEAAFVAAEAGGTRQSEMVVTLEDVDGKAYRIRHALSAKEIGRLHRVFLSAKLNVQFRPEHRFLVAINERGYLIGGLFYELEPDAHTAHMDKLVVAERFRRKGVAAALLEELCNRLRTAGFRSLTTGFFRPQFFYQHGFSVERRYAGLVRSLDDGGE